MGAADDHSIQVERELKLIEHELGSVEEEYDGALQADQGQGESS